MKRILASVLVLSVLSVCLVGCGEKKAAPKKDAPAAAPAAPAAAPAGEKKN